jgi:hypothetical protein
LVAAVTVALHAPAVTDASEIAANTAIWRARGRDRFTRT